MRLETGTGTTKRDTKQRNKDQTLSQNTRKFTPQVAAGWDRTGLEGGLTIKVSIERETESI